MQCESRFLASFIALRRARTLAAALLVAAIFIGALGAAVPVMLAQQAGFAAPAGSRKAAPPPKAETPPPAESTTEILPHTANSALPAHQHFSVSFNNVFVNFQIDIRESQKFTPERKL